MTRQIGMACAGVVLATALGCTLPIGNSGVQLAVNVNEQVVNDKVEIVAQKLETEMRRLGLEVTVAPDAEAVRLVSTTKSGQRFTVFVNRVPSSKGDQARVRVEWAHKPDAALWTQLVSAIVLSQTTTAAAR